MLSKVAFIVFGVSNAIANIKSRSHKKLCVQRRAKSGPVLLSKNHAGQGRKLTQTRDHFVAHFCTTEMCVKDAGNACARSQACSLHLLRLLYLSLSLVFPFLSPPPPPSLSNVDAAGVISRPSFRTMQIVRLVQGARKRFVNLATKDPGMVMQKS